jgi:hypothetical protein
MHSYITTDTPLMREKKIPQGITQQPTNTHEKPDNKGNKGQNRTNEDENKFDKCSGKVLNTDRHARKVTYIK